MKLNPHKCSGCGRQCDRRSAEEILRDEADFFVIGKIKDIVAMPIPKSITYEDEYVLAIVPVSKIMEPIKR